ncbi:hypothetical protein E3O44_12530 [Cryobacterium algoricola]|uniref:N-terminal domain-containing protein n=1 Tax=Cryobacterium algoricola TaxID=1259183 RepID=A0ABY2IAR6_9MICO|nr:ArdC-like ssDNA-binding domain-containing protein [Cryobacterium algoricola]TFB85821.1 hypothetical protein E3O44_12530 [Cryobacterium algoricola]
MTELLTNSRPKLETPSNRELLEGLLTIEGSTGETYRRFWNYSPRNIGFLALQGCPPEPVATYQRWTQLNRQVQKGSKAFSILRPIAVKVESKNDDEEQKMIRRFKVVRALFPLSQTEGEEIPPYEPLHWSVDRALGALAIERVPFESYNGNIGGYAVGRTIALNPLAPNPLRTTLHEISHIEHGHTSPDQIAQYQGHRGEFEYQAEASAFICLNELGELDKETARISRGYAQSWVNDQPTEASVVGVLNVSTKVLNAGREAPKETQ